MEDSKKPNYTIRFFILANILIALGLLMNYALPPLVNLYIDSQLTLAPSSQAYPMWKDIPVPIYQKFYFFNVRNPNEIEQRGQNPILEEIGPFTYRAEFEKRDIDRDSDDKTISFKHYKKWFFEPDMSIADEDLQIVTINAPLAITLTLIQSASNAVRLLVTFSLDGLSEGFFTKRSVKQLLFEGYPDLLTTFGPLLNAEMLSQGGHFGYMNARNNSPDGTYEVYTGEDNLSKLNTIRKFNGQTNLSYWQNECSAFEGSTTGEMFPLNGVNDSFIKIFQPDFCRAWRLDKEFEYEHESGLKLDRFIATRDVFKNSTEAPENACFYKKHNERNNRVPNIGSSNRLGRNNGHRQHHHANNHHNNRVRYEWPSGVFSLAPCKFNAPIFISMPHFLDADPYYQAHVDGLSPDPDKHQFYIDVEPRTGSPIELSVRVQLNIAISKPPGIVRLRNVPEIMFPIFWQEFSVNLTGPVLDQLYLASRGADETVTLVAHGIILLGVIIIIPSIFLYTFYNKY